MRRFLVIAICSMALGVAGCTTENATAGANNPSSPHDGGADAADAEDAGSGARDGGESDGGETDGGGQDADGDSDADAGELDGGSDADGGGGDADGGEEESVSIAADDQFLAAADSNRVSVASAVSDGPGWAVIHEDDAGEPGDILGHAPLVDGENSEVVVDLDRDVEDGETLHAMLHEDEGEVGTFEPEEDAPEDNDDGALIVDAFSVALPTVNASPELLDDLSTVVTVDAVHSKGDGWLVVHDDGCANAPSLEAGLGHAFVSDGQTDDVEVALDRPAEDDETLCAVLHVDEPADGEFGFEPGDDAPDDPPAALAESGELILDTFDVQVPDGTPAIRITLSNSGIDDYSFDSVEPSKHDSGMAGELDPDLLLYQDWRYEIDNTVSGTHPFELLDETGIRERVILSQEEEGDGENNGSIDWEESGDSIFFTVAGGFFGDGFSTAEIDTYRCAFHDNRMTGAVIVQDH